MQKTEGFNKFMDQLEAINEDTQYPTNDPIYTFKDMKCAWTRALDYGRNVAIFVFGLTMALFILALILAHK